MPNGLIIGEDEKVAAWAFSSFSLTKTHVDRAFGIVDVTPKIVGAVLFQNFNGTNVELSYYGPRTLSSGIVRAIARVVSLEFNAARVTVITSKKNKRLMRGLQRLGFRLEGSQRRYFGKRDCARSTGVRFVMFREEVDRIAKILISPVANQV
jgi:RimJ/RimL family protein N-acetyltransferase